MGRRMDNITTKLGRIRKMVNKLTQHSDDTEVTLEFLLTFLFPTVWSNIQEEMRNQYTKGYVQGKEDAKNE